MQGGAPCHLQFIGSWQAGQVCFNDISAATRHVPACFPLAQSGQQSPWQMESVPVQSHLLPESTAMHHHVCVTDPISAGLIPRNLEC